MTSTCGYTVPELVKQSNMIWITTPDDQIEHVWNELVRYDLEGRLICHTSGAKDSSVFEGITRKGAYGYSVHPMYAFADKNGQCDGLETASFTLEGESSRRCEFQNLFTLLGNRLYIIDRQYKPLYHLANVMVTNLVLSLFSIGSEYMTQCGSFGSEALDVLMPLIENNIANLKRNGLIQALTGPVERNDSGTVLKHLECMAPADACLYKELSKRLLELAARKHPGKDYTRMRQILEE